MRGRERRQRIEEILTENGEVNVDQLAERLLVTASTIRRDLARLTADGKVTRTYGGAVVRADLATESTLHVRESVYRIEKDMIGRFAAGEVQDGETVILDAGSTVGRVAHHLQGHARLTVVTPSLTSIRELADTDDIEVIVVGGSLRHVSQGMGGPLADHVLWRVTADRVFLGADGLHPSYGICEAEPEQTRIKELMASRARECYVLVDSSKLGAQPFKHWAPLRQYTLVTDDGADEACLEQFRSSGNVHVVVVPTTTSVEGLGEDAAEDDAK